MVFVILLASFVVISASSAANVNEDIQINDVGASNVVTEDIVSVGNGNDDGVVEVTNEAELKNAIANNSVKEIKIKNDIELSASIVVPKNHTDLTINGQGNQIYAATNFAAKPSGGAFYWDAKGGKLTDCTFTGFNDPKIENGGVIFWAADDGWLDKCSFGGNSASRWGGAICWFGDDGIISECGFENNSAKLEGNSIFVSASRVNINYCQFAQANPNGSECEIYISNPSKKVIIAFNTFQTKPSEGFYAALHIASGEQFGDWATVRLAENKFGVNYILNNGKILSPIKMVFDSKVVKKGEKAVITGTIFDDNGNYIITDADIYAYVDGDFSKGYLGDPCDLFYYFEIPTADLKPGVHKLTASIVEENDDVTFEGTLTVVDSSNPNPSPKKGIPMEHTGNPLVVLLIGLATVGLGSLKRKL